MSHKISKPELKAINRLAIPAILSGIAEPIISLIDIAFIGRAGTTQLAAVGIASGFYLMSVWILAQTLTAISAIVSKQYGRQNLSEIKSLIPQALLANVLLGLAFYAITSWFSNAIFGFYKAEGEILEACKGYYAIRSIGFPFTLGTLLLFGTFRGLQNTSWAMLISTCGAMLNILLDYYLIFGLEDYIKPMGLRGAALASLCAQMLMFVIALAFLLWRTPFNLRLRRNLNGHFKWLARMSGDLFVRTIVLNLTFYLATRYATGYGEAVIATHTICLNVWLFSSFFIDGYANAGNAIAGKLSGENKPGDLFALGKNISSIAFWIGIGLAVFYTLSYPFLAKLFTEDAVVIELFNNVFWLVIISQPVNALAFALDGIYKGLGETKKLRNLLITSTLLGFLPVAFAFHRFSPSLLGIWIAFLVWMVVRSGWLVWDFLQNITKGS